MELIAILFLTAILAHVWETVRDEHGHVRDTSRKALKDANPGRSQNWVKRHAAMRTARWWGSELLRGLPSIRHNYAQDRDHVKLLRTRGEADRFRTRAAMVEELRRAKAERDKAAEEHAQQQAQDAPQDDPPAAGEPEGEAPVPQPAGEDPGDTATEQRAPVLAPVPSPPQEGDSTMTTGTTTGTDASAVTGEAGGYEAAITQAKFLQQLASDLVSKLEAYQSDLITNAKLGADTAVISSLDQEMEGAQQMAAGAAAHLQALSAHEPGHEYATTVQAPADTAWLQSA